MKKLELAPKVVRTLKRNTPEMHKIYSYVVEHDPLQKVKP